MLKKKDVRRKIISSVYNLNGFKEEIIDGKVYYILSSANPRHGRIIGNIYLIFMSYLKGKTCGLFIDKGYNGISSLIVEVISPN